MNLRSALLVLCVSFVVAGCSTVTWLKDFATPVNMLDPPAFDQVSIGMTSESVADILGEPYQKLSAEQVENAFVEEWEYIRYEVAPGPDKVERYRVKFVDGLLFSYKSLGITKGFPKPPQQKL